MGRCGSGWGPLQGAQLVNDTPKRPYVRLAVVSFSPTELGGDVVRCPTASLGHEVLCVTMAPRRRVRIATSLLVNYQATTSYLRVKEAGQAKVPQFDVLLPGKLPLGLG